MTGVPNWLSLFGLKLKHSAFIVYTLLQAMSNQQTKCKLVNRLKSTGWYIFLTNYVQTSVI